MVEHQSELDILKFSNLPIERAIEELVRVYAQYYQVDAYHINCGLCEMFGGDIEYLFPEAVGAWGDEFANEDDDYDLYAYHYIVRYRGRFYDSQHPNGVVDFRDISAFPKGIKSEKG